MCPSFREQDSVFGNGQSQNLMAHIKNRRSGGFLGSDRLPSTVLSLPLTQDNPLHPDFTAVCFKLWQSRGKQTEISVTQENTDVDFAGFSPRGGHQLAVGSGGPPAVTVAICFHRFQVPFRLQILYNCILTPEQFRSRPR